MIHIFETKDCELWQGDCLELMKNIPDKSIDMVLCDLPFGVTRNDWDVPVPFEELWKQYDRIVKENGAVVLNSKKQPLRNCEDIAVFYRKQCTYNPIMRKGKPSLKATGSGSSNYNKYTYQPHISELYYPTTLLEIPLPRFKGGHPTQKPVPLCEYLIKTYTNEGETVLDNCMGSGSTGVAALNLGRKFIGIELNEDYYNMALSRMA